MTASPDPAPTPPDFRRRRRLLIALVSVGTVLILLAVVLTLRRPPAPAPTSFPTPTVERWSVATIMPSDRRGLASPVVAGFYCNSCASDACRQRCQASGQAVGMHNRFLWCEVMPAANVVDVQPIMAWVRANAAAGLRSVIGLSPKTDRGYTAPNRGSCTATSDGSPAWMLAPGSVYAPLQNGEGSEARYHLNYRNSHVQAQLRLLLATLRQEMARLEPAVLASIDSFELDIGHDGELDPARNYDNFPANAPLGWMDGDMYRCLYAGYTWNKARSAQTCTDRQNARIDPRRAWGAIPVWRDEVIKPFVDIYGQELSVARQGRTVGKPLALMVVGQMVSADERSGPCAGCNGLNVVDYAWETYGIGVKVTGINPDLGNGNGEDKLNAEYRNWANILHLTWPSRLVIGEHGTNGVGSGLCCDDERELYWAVLNALDKHVQQLHFSVGDFTQSAAGVKVARQFFARYAGAGVDTTPDVWIVFRDTEGTYYPDGANGQPQGNPPGRPPCCRWLPNYEWFVYQTNPKLEQVVRSGLPSTPAYRTLSARSTRDGALELDVEDLWPEAQQKPRAAGGCAAYGVEVIYADFGTDSFAVRYATFDGAVRERRVAKTGTGAWQSVVFDLDDAYLANRLSSGADLELVNTAGTHDIFHLVRVEPRGSCRAAPVAPATATPAPSSTPTPSPTRTATPSATPPPEVIAKIEILWPHDGQPVLEATRANITAYLFRDDALNPVRCDYDPVVQLWQATNAQPARLVGLGQKRMLTREGRTFSVWDFNDVDVSLARNPNNKLYFFVRVKGVPTRHNIWAHAADARTFFPLQDTPQGVIPGPFAPVTAKIQILWPHDNRPVAEADRANLTGVLFAANTQIAVSADSTWQPVVQLHAALNNGVNPPAAHSIVGSPRTAPSGAYRVWDFNDVDVSAARDPQNKLYFWLDVAGVTTFPNIWSHGADARTIFPLADLPASSCQ